MKKVMIVDDDPNVLKGVEAVLTRHGCEVVQAPSGQACLALLRQGFHGVILMDITMPGMTGWETIRALVAENLLDHNLICMLTGETAPGAAADGLEEYVFDYLAKPFERESLTGLVDNALGMLAS